VHVQCIGNASAMLEKIFYCRCNKGLQQKSDKSLE